MKYLDTSIILETILNGAKLKPECNQILESVKQGKEVVAISTMNLSELFYILLHRENLGLSFVTEYLERLLDLSGLELIDLSPDLIKQGIQLSRKFQIDLTDACSVAWMHANKVRQIYSLDQNYDKFKDIQRLIQLS